MNSLELSETKKPAPPASSCSHTTTLIDKPTYNTRQETFPPANSPETIVVAASDFRTTSMNRKKILNKHVQSRNDATGSIVQSKGVPEDATRIHKDDHCITVNDYTKYEHETIDKKVHNTANNNTPEKIKLQINQVDTNVGSSSSPTSYLDTECQPEQPLSEKTQNPIEGPRQRKRAIERSRVSVDIQQCNSLATSQTSALEKAADPEQPVQLSDVKQGFPPPQNHSIVNRRGSIAHRRRHSNSLLKPNNPTASIQDDCQIEKDKFQTSGGFIRRTFLNPKFRLRTQLLLAFGSVSAFIILFVLIVSVIIAWYSSENLKSINQANFEDLVGIIERDSVRYRAESLTPSLIPKDAVRILYESVRDRFAGYPTGGDEYVPFFDIDSQTNKYPVIGVAGKTLPLDWQIEANVNDDNYEEHVQHRWPWYNQEPLISTSNAFYIMQGMCDPSVTDPSAFTYWENCTAANNDVSTGGTVNPSPTNNQIYRKARSLSPILKALFESHQNFRSVSILFSNSGAGSAMIFPHFQLRTGGAYPSDGCEWMNAPNPYDPSRPIGTKEEIARCRPEGTMVSTRLYNVLERGWCRDQALNPFKLLIDGPYVDALNGALVMSAGQGIYDRITNEFIGCSYVEWYMDDIEQVLNDSKVTENSEASVARFDDGTTVVSTVWDPSTATDTIKVYNLNVGLNFESFEELKTLVDYNKTWDPTEVRKKYDTFTPRQDGFLVAIHPIPPVPESYDPSYIPLFFAMLSASEQDIFQVGYDVQTSFDEHSVQVMYMSLIVGAIGLVIVLLIIYLMSKALTAPLEYMNKAADEIVHHVGNKKSSTRETDIVDLNPGYFCFPSTELDEMVTEFNHMVTSFDFASASKSVEDKREEIPNEVTVQQDLHNLYESRKEIKFGYRVGRIGSCQVDTTRFIHLGPNIGTNEEARSGSKMSIVMADRHGKGGFTSRLFFWTVVLIGTPLLWTTIAISGMVIYNFSTEFHSSIETAEAYYLEVKSNALSVRAHVVSSGTSRPVRDLYMLTRYASWLLFGGVERAESFTQVKTGMEQCKAFDDVTDCPFYQEHHFCDCAWNDAYSTCRNYAFDTRDRQGLYFSSEASDRFSNGDRNFTMFPNVSYSPASTVWWDDALTLPGSNKKALASGYETTYDRLRVISASPLHQVVYNQDIEKEYSLLNSISFEADGMYIGFDGCPIAILGATRWSSTEANGAYKLRPELCPLGKFGYDPRCRGWYDTGKRLAEKDGTPLHVTPPYVFTDSSIGQSATSPLIDPQTKEHIGQVLVDFQSGPVLDSLSAKNVPHGDTGFPILITTSSGPDSVVGPGFSLFNESARPISELVMPHDRNCNETECMERRGRFDQILSSMKNGESGNTNFTRRSPTGSIETVYIAYAPVVVNGYRPLDSSDFSRGVEAYEVLVYSLAWAQTEDDLLGPFEEIQEANNKKIRVSIALFSVIIFLCILFATFIMSVVTLSVIGPMLVLLEVINSINRLDMTEEPPIINHSTGSIEVNCFSDTIQTLYKVARCGHYAFLSSDLERAYTIMCDACQLFHRLNNKTAVGVVSNNIGNLLLVVFRSLDGADENEFCGMKKAEIINKGISFYYDAIQLGEEVYEQFQQAEGLSPNCLDFMEHLSNRYFNRGMFLLTVKNGHTEPDELEKLGYRDLDISADLDMEIVDIGLKAGLEQGTSVLKKYDVALVRAKGHLTLQEMGYPDTWDVEDRLDHAFVMVTRELQKNSDSSLFQEITAFGRLQEVETELIRYNVLKGEVRLAAQIGIRMLIEDEYIFPEAKMKALEALSIYEEQSLDDNKDNRTKHAMFKTRDDDVFDDGNKGRVSVSFDSLPNMKHSPQDRDLSTSMSRMLKLLGNSSRGYLAMEEL